MTLAMWDKLDAIETRYRELAEEMARPEVAADFERLQAVALNVQRPDRRLSPARHRERLRRRRDLEGG